MINDWKKFFEPSVKVPPKIGDFVAWVTGFNHGPTILETKLQYEGHNVTCEVEFVGFEPPHIPETLVDYIIIDKGPEVTTHYSFGDRVSCKIKYIYIGSMT